MWVFLNSAFLSIVEDKDDWHDLWVRARLRGDIERVFPDAEVAETPPPADYRFRSKLARGIVERAMMLAVSGINYTNFKKSVQDQRRHDAYLRVWSDMAHEQGIQRIEDMAGSTPTMGGKVGERAFRAAPPEPEFFVPKEPVSRRGKTAKRPRASRPKK